MAEAAANGLLKTLEEPGKATLILMAPSVESLLPTLVSRCQRIPFGRLGKSNLEAVLRQTGHDEILQSPSILAIAEGSPGAAIKAFEQLKAIPATLLTSMMKLPKTSRKALELAKEIDQALDSQAQLWLIDYLQHCYWQQFLDGKMAQSPLQQLENARKYLLGYAQPRLVWEVTLLELAQI